MDIKDVVVLDRELPINPSQEQLISLLAAIFPDFEQTDDFSFRQFTDGLTNRLFKIHCNATKTHRVLIRIYGEKTELLIDREKELISMIHLHKANLAPKVYAKFTNGVCYGFLEGKTFTVADMKDDVLFKLVAKHMAKFHSVEIPDIDHEPSLFNTYSNWQKYIENPVNSRDNNEVTSGLYSSDSFNNEVNWIKSQVEKYDWDICFCHNDLLAGNLLHQNNNSVDFIDYEYGSYNYALFDVGNHLCEMMGPEVNLEVCFSFFLFSFLFNLQFLFLF